MFVLLQFVVDRLRVRLDRKFGVNPTTAHSEPRFPRHQLPHGKGKRPLVHVHVVLPNIESVEEN